jgi:hypothetical protein
VCKECDLVRATPGKIKGVIAQWRAAPLVVDKARMTPELCDTGGKLFKDRRESIEGERA